MPSGISSTTCKSQKTLNGERGAWVGCVVMVVNARPCGDPRGIARILSRAMSAASGLQRRRAPGGEARTGTPYASDDEDDVVRGRSAQRAKDCIVERSAGSGSIAAIDTRSGQRYAYDPRDVGDEREMLSHPRLTLMEEVLLLGLKDRQGYLSFWNDNISYTLRGAILMELALRGRIAVARNGDQKRFEAADRIVEVRDAKNTGEPLLDETLRMIKSSPPAGIAEWMDLLSGTCAF